MPGCGTTFAAPRRRPEACTHYCALRRPRVSPDSRPFYFRVEPAADSSSVRLDTWLWRVRIFRNRGLATDACRAGSVEIGGQAAKASRDVRVGDIVTVRQGVVLRTLVVRGWPANRVGAVLVADFLEDRTPPEEFAKARREPVANLLAREKGSGRPTKRDRRLLDRLLLGGDGG